MSQASQEVATERWKRDGWFDFAVPAIPLWDVAQWCEPSESGYGLVRQVDRLRPCTEGTTIECGYPYVSRTCVNSR